MPNSSSSDSPAGLPERRSDLVAWLRGLAEILDQVSDIVEQRLATDSMPAGLAVRGWGPFLLGLDDAPLRQCERDGLAWGLMAELGPPASLLALCERVRSLTTVQPLDSPPAEMCGRWAWRIPGPKVQQVRSLIGWLAQRGGSRGRVLDVGSGHGHLTRALSEYLRVEATGIESDEARVTVARHLAGQDGPGFVLRDGRAGLPVRAGDLVVGLHACGELGDQLVQQARRSGAELLLVSCCPQKISGRVRTALSEEGSKLGLSFTRDRLGLANAGATAHGTAERAMVRRRDRHALRLLLRERGIETEVGGESRGVSRHHFGKGLESVAKLAFEYRGLRPATREEVASTQAEAEHQFGRIRRLSLPRKMMGRVLETALVLDRAVALEEIGYRVEVRQVFDPQVSPRNLGILALSGGLS